MDRSPSPPHVFQRRTATKSSAFAAKGIRDFLQASNDIAALLPAVARMAALQKDCALALPAMFDACAVLQFSSGQLVLSTPNSAIGARLKQQLPTLQDFLCKRGWQVSAVRLRMQVGRPAPAKPAGKQLVLPGAALGALAELKTALDASPRNAALAEAVKTMLERHAGRQS